MTLSRSILDDPIFKAEIETQTWRKNVWIPRGKYREWEIFRD